MTDAASRAAAMQARRALAVLLLVSLFNYLDRSLLSILQVPIKKELGLSDGQLGAVTGLSFAIFYATAALPIARLVDRHRRTWIMAACVLVWTSMTALSSLAAGFVSLVALRIGVALGEAGSVPATHSLLSDYFPLKNRGTVFSLWAAAPSAGIMLGVFFGGRLSTQLGWRHSFLLVGLSGLVLMLPILLLREPTRGQHDAPVLRGDGRAPSLSVALRTLWGSVSFRLLVAGVTFQTFGYSALINWLPPFLVRAHHMPLKAVALWAALIIGLGGGAGAVAGGVLVDWLIRKDRRWYAWAPALATLLSVPFGLGFLLAPRADAAISLGFAAIFLATFFVAPANALAQSLVSPFMRGFTAAVLILVPTIFGVGLGPFVTGVVSDLLSHVVNGGGQALRYAMASTLGASVVGGVLLMALGGGLLQGLPRPANALV